jgi:hypothetical protein
MRALISGFGRRFAQRCRAERAYRQLDTMDGRMLRDIGLDRPRIALIPCAETRRILRSL